MSKVRRVDFSPDEWIAGTRELTLDERGAYWDVCALMYSRGGPIADDEAWIAKALTCHVRTWRTIRTRLIAKGKLQAVDGMLFNGRTIREIERAESRLRNSREAAESSARERRLRAEERSTERREEPDNEPDLRNFNGIAEAGASESNRAITNHQPSTTNQEDITQAESVERGALAEGSPPAKRDAKGERLPEGWRPEDDLRQWTISSIRDASSGVSAGHELERFRDYWRAQPGAKGRKTDWPATWRNWIRRAIEQEGKGNGPHRGGSAQGRADTAGEEDPVTAGIRESLARRHVLAGG